MEKRSKLSLRGLIIALSLIAGHVFVAVFHNGVKDGQATLHAQAKTVK